MTKMGLFVVFKNVAYHLAVYKFISFKMQHPSINDSSMVFGTLQQSLTLFLWEIKSNIVVIAKLKYYIGFITLETVY